MRPLFTIALGWHSGMSTRPAAANSPVRLSESEFRERLRELPPSAKRIAKLLEREEPLSQGERAEESLLPDRTVRYALNRLEDSELIGSRYSLKDARKQVYYRNMSC